MVGKSHLPAAERKASVKQTNHEAPAKQIKTDALKAAAALAEAVVPVVAPAASRLERLAVARLNAKTKMEVPKQRSSHKSAVKVAWWRAARKAAK